jgi:hypothetical protein
VVSKHILERLKIICGHCGSLAKKTGIFCDDFLNDDFRYLEKNSDFLS